MTPNFSSQQPASPSLRTSAAERRHSASAFRASLERRLPQAAVMVEAECLLPPVGRSEAFAEDLTDEPGNAGAVPSSASGGRRSRLRWWGLPVLVLGVGTTLGLPGITTLAGF